MKWSHYSQNLFDWFTNTTDNLIVQACPGSGKTTNINHLCTLTDATDSTLYLAFNKSIVEEARVKLPEHITVKTLNGLGHGAIYDHFGRVKLDSYKVRGIIDELNLFSRSDRRIFEKRHALFKAVDKMKHLHIENITEFEDMLDLHDMEEYEGMYEHAKMVLSLSDKMTHVIDFNDQIRFPVIYNLSMPQIDNILCDEVQDFSSMQAELIHKLKGRYVLVGDKHQAIYGFRGAMSNSMSFLKGYFNCVELPLSLTYRCPKLVVNEARKLFDDIEALDDAKDGVVRYSEASKESYDDTTLVVCRNNAPLISLAYRLLRDGKPCHVKGRDIAEGLTRLVKKQDAVTVKELIDKLDDWYDNETYKARRKDNEAKLQSLEDKYRSLLVFTEGISLDAPPSEVVERIDKLFANGKGKGTILSTIHKAKGLEAERVFILDKHLMPAPYAKQEWQKEQEKNIEYVAITRSKDELVYM